ncbi:hypothetical protein LTR67_008318 [Exophiala xenobiotica]
MLAQPAVAVAVAVPVPPHEHHFNVHISAPTAVQSLPRLEKPGPNPSKAFTIRAATIDDAEAIAHLGATVFSTTFGFSIPTADLEAYLGEAYTGAAIENDIRSSSTHIIVACAESDGRVIGFAQLTEGTSEPCVDDLEGVVELQRLYVEADFRSSGVGRVLTTQSEDLARKLGYRIVWLGVWEGNFKAQRVYEAMGFTRVGEHEFKMGTCIQTDWIMVKDL